MFKHFDEKQEIRGITLDSLKAFDNVCHDANCKNDLFDDV